MAAALTRGVPASWPWRTRFVCTLAIVGGGALVAVSALIHLHLWLAGYRHIHLIGPSFLFQFASGVVLAAALVISRWLSFVMAGALFMAGSVGALLLSATVGFLGLHDGLGVPWATTSLVVELAGFVVLAGSGVVLAVRT